MIPVDAVVACNRGFVDDQLRIIAWANAATTFQGQRRGVPCQTALCPRRRVVGTAETACMKLPNLLNRGWLPLRPITEGERNPRVFGACFQDLSTSMPISPSLLTCSYLLACCQRLVLFLNVQRLCIETIPLLLAPLLRKGKLVHGLPPCPFINAFVRTVQLQCR